MTVSRPEPVNPGVEAWAMEDEIDLREYIEVLVQWWREILALALLAALVAAAVVLGLRAMKAPVYQSAATVVIARTQSDVQFEERFRTLSENELQSALSDVTSRRAALVGLASSGAIASAVIDELGTELTDEQQIPANLLESIDAQLVSTASSRSGSDLIQIVATAKSPEKAADIANAWARHYVDQVNRLYGQVPGELLASVQTELQKAKVAYDASQKDLEGYIANSQIDRLDRLIEEKQAVIDSLQTGKQTAITTIVDEELQARRQIISAYINAQASNRLLAFQKEQDAKQQIITKYIEADIENRILAFDKDHQARIDLFNRLVDAQTNATTTVFDEQVQEKLHQLNRAYTEKARLQTLLGHARGLQSQIVAGGDAAAQTNGLALLLLKSQIFASSDALPGNLQLNLDTVPGLQTDAAQQQEDLDALIGVLNDRIAELDETIQTQSEQLLSGDGYQFLDGMAASQLAISAPVSSTVALSGGQTANNSALAAAIRQRYADLYKVGGLTESGQDLATSADLFTSIRKLYPQLFDLGDMSQLTELVQDQNALAIVGAEKAKQLLQLQGLEDLPAYSAAAEPLSQAINQLESEIQTLQAQREAEDARRQSLTQQRDLTWETYTTLSNKNAELTLSNMAANSEVRFAAPAVPPVEPVKGPSLIETTALAGIVGLMLAVFIAFFANFMGQEPLFSRRRSEATAEV